MLFIQLNLKGADWLPFLFSITLVAAIALPIFAPSKV